MLICVPCLHRLTHSSLPSKPREGVLSFSFLGIWPFFLSLPLFHLESILPDGAHHVRLRRRRFHPGALASCAAPVRAGSKGRGDRVGQAKLTLRSAACTGAGRRSLSTIASTGAQRIKSADQVFAL